MAILLIRTILLYFLILLAMKAMGKRQIGQLQPFELVVVIIISDMASLAMQSPTATLANSIIPIAVITIMQITLSLVNLKSEKSRSLLCGEPIFLIKDGKLQEQNMARLRLNINDLEELTRSQGYFDINTIKNAVMETNGQLSIMPQTANRPLELGDVDDDPDDEKMGILLILDGHINQKALRISGYNEKWLTDKLKAVKAGSPAKVFVAGLDEKGQFFWQKKDESRCSK